MSILSTVMSPWVALNKAASSGASLSALGVAERTYSAVQDLASTRRASIFRVGDVRTTGGNGIRIRCLGAADTNNMVYEVYIGTLAQKSDCDLTYLGSLDFTTGTQVSSTTGYNLCSQVTVTEGDTTADWDFESADDDRVAEATIDLQGEDVLVIVPTTLGGDAILQGKLY